MAESEAEQSDDAAVINRAGVAALLQALVDCGHHLVGPTVRDGAIIYTDITGLTDLPQGWTDRQAGGSYRLERRGDAALFGYAATPQSWKRFLHPPTVRLWRAERTDDGFAISEAPEPARKIALIAARACDLQAIAIQDRVLQGGRYPDPGYAARRRDIFVVAVNCGSAGGTCFCVSMQTGPRVRSGFDLALTELIDGDRHEFLVEVGSPGGAALLAQLPRRRAGGDDVAAAAAVVARTAAAMGRAMPRPADVPALLRRNLEHPRWEAVADRCLSCANCTMVCPTCFCTSVEDTISLDGRTAERVQRWDSCFTMDFSHVHGGSVRASPRSRYRQWMTHKLSTWWEQFGTSGCVGCGRCITWCPVGIDITEEVAAIAATDGAGGARGTP